MFKITDKNRTQYLIALTSLSAISQILWIAMAPRGLSGFVLCFAFATVVPLVFIARNLKHAFFTSVTSVCVPIPLFTIVLLLLALFLEAYKKGMSQAFTTDHLTTMVSAVSLPFMTMMGLMLPVFGIVIAAKYACTLVKK